MTDLATLGLEIRSDGVVVASDRLKKFGEDARRTETATGNLTRSFGALKSMLGGLLAAFGLRELLQITSAWTDLNSRVNNAAGSIEKGTAVMGRLTEMSRRTYSSLTQTAESWLSNASSLDAMGYSTEQQLDLTEALNNALVISATRGERAQSVMNAWAKAMDLGKLSGDNLNSVISGSDRLSQALADSMGVSVLELRRLGSEGKITATEMFGVTKELENLRLEAETMPATPADAILLLGDAAFAAVGKFDQMVGASSRVAEAIIWVADRISDGTLSIERLLAMATSMALFMAGSWVAGFIAANGAVGALTLGLTALRGALIRTGIGALVVLAGELIFRLYDVVEGAESMEDALDRLGQSGVETLQRIGDGALALVAVMDGVGASITASFASTWANILQGFIGMMNSIAGRGNPFSMAAGDAWMGAEGRTGEYEALAATKFAEAQAAWDRAWAPKGSQSTATGGAGGGGADLSGDGAPGGGGSVGGGGGGSTKRNPYADLIRGAQEFIKEQELEAQALGMTEEAAARLRFEQEMLNDAANDNINLTPRQREEIGLLAGAMAAAESATKKAKDAFDFAKGAVKGFLSDMRQGLNDGKSLWEAFGGAAMNVLDKLINKIEDQFVDALFSMGGTGTQGGGFNLFSMLGGLFGFASGGYTGNRATHQVAGVVHGGEYVFSAKATSRIGVANLEAMHSSAKGYAGGGYVGAPPVMNTPANTGGYLNVTARMEVVDGNLVPTMTEIAGEVSGQTVAQAAPAIVQTARSGAAKDAPAAVNNHQRMRGGSDYRTM